MPDWLAHVLFAYVLCSVLGTRDGRRAHPGSRLGANEMVVAKLLFLMAGCGSDGETVFGSVEQKRCRGKPHEN